MLLLDDITRLRMHRADDQDVLDLIRAFKSMHVTFVLIGVDIPGSGLLREGRHDPRTGQWTFPPSRHAGARVLEATQTELADGVMPEYLYRRTDGVVGLRYGHSDVEKLAHGALGPEHVHRHVPSVLRQDL